MLHDSDCCSVCFAEKPGDGELISGFQNKKSATLFIVFRGNDVRRKSKLCRRMSCFFGGVPEVMILAEEDAAGLRNDSEIF